MMDVETMDQRVLVKPETTKLIKVKTATLPVKKTSIFNTVIISLLIFIMLSYAVYDSSTENTQIQQKALIISNKMDSLNIYINNEFPNIEKNNKLQVQQIKDLEQMSLNNR